MEAVASILTVVQVGIAVAKSADKLKRWKNTPSALSRLQEEVSHSTTVLLEIESLLQAKVNDQPTDLNLPTSLTLASEKLKRSLLDLETLVADMTDARALKVKRTHWTWNEHRIENLRKRLAESQSYLLFSLSMTLLASQTSVKQDRQLKADLHLQKLSNIERRIDMLDKESSIITGASIETRERQKRSLVDDTQGDVHAHALGFSTDRRRQPGCSRTGHQPVPNLERSPLRLYNIRSSDSSIFLFARMDFVEEVKKLLVMGQASLLDVEYPHNKTALYVSKFLAEANLTSQEVEHYV